MIKEDKAITGSIRTRAKTIPMITRKELIKIKFHEFKDNKQEISEKIANDTFSLIVGIIGHTLILFKQNSNPEKQK